MIVEPDLPDHWKTRLLTALCQEYERERPGTLEPEGPIILVLRLWAHCQLRRAWVFPGMTDVTLAAICRWRGEAPRLKDILLESKWLDPDKNGVTVHGWGEVNAKLVANWINGPKGGRPRHESKPSSNPTATQRKPSSNPSATHSKPIDQIEEREKRESTGARSFPPSVLEVIEMGQKLARRVPEDFCRHFHREKTKRRSWEKTDWVMDLEDWWAKDEASWKKRAAEKENGGEKAALVQRLEKTTDPKERQELLKQVGAA